MAPGQARALGDLVPYVQARVAPGKPVFASDPLLYVLLDRPNPTRYDSLEPTLGTASGEQRELVAALRRAQPQVVVRRPSGARGGRALDDYLQSAYEPDRRIGRDYEVLRPRRLADAGG